MAKDDCQPIRLDDVTRFGIDYMNLHSGTIPENVEKAINYTMTNIYTQKYTHAELNNREMR